MIHNSSCRAVVISSDRNGLSSVSFANSICWASIDNPEWQGCPSFRQWILLSSLASIADVKGTCFERSTDSFRGQLIPRIKDPIYNGAGVGEALDYLHLSPGECLLPPTTRHIFLCNKSWTVLFQLTSGAWMYLVQPPGTKQHQSS